MLSQEDLNTLRSQNYQLIFNIGVPYSGKKTQCEKISKEFKYSKIIMKEIIQKEIASKTNLGIQAKQSLENKEPIKTEILVSILISNIIESHELSIMIEGFPNTLEQALFFEQKVIPINKIIIYDTKEEEVIIDAKKQAFEEGQKNLSYSDRLLNDTMSKMKVQAEEIIKQMKEIKSSLDELDKIALKPIVLTNVEYFQQMIDFEKEQKKKGYQKRIEGLEMMKNQAEQLNAMSKAEDITQLFSSFR